MSRYKNTSLHLLPYYLAAVKELDKAIAINPNCEYFNELAQNYFSLGKPNECYKNHELAIEHSPQNLRFYFTYGCHLSKANLQKAAISKFKKAIELKPNYGEAKRALEYAQAPM